MRKPSNTKIIEIAKKITDHDYGKYITTPAFNKLAVQNFAVRLAQAKWASKSDIVNFVKTTDVDDKQKNLSKKFTSNKTKQVLVESELKNFKHLTQVFLLVKVTLIMMEHNFT